MTGLRFGAFHYIILGTKDKLGALQSICEDLRIGIWEAAYIGDDVNDLSCIRAVKKAGGLIGCPADAIKDIKQLADFVSVKNGGDGAVRDFIEWLCDIKNEN